MKLTKIMALAIGGMISFPSFSQVNNDYIYKTYDLSRENYRQNLVIPDIDGYVTMKCDFHIHTIFSDGRIWPEAVVNEAWNCGLDAIAITDHIEKRKNEPYFKGDRNTSYDLAKKRGDRIGMIVVKGAEITRQKPLGHVNALFIKDANKLFVEDEMDAIDEAVAQGGFLVWNHPGFRDPQYQMYPIIRKLVAEKKIRGMEVFNKREYYPNAFNYIGEYNIAPFANSDLHNNLIQQYSVRGSMPMTLVFAKERSEEALKEAMFAGRTVALFAENLVGKEEFIKALVDKSIEIKEICNVNKSTKTFEITNKTDIRFSIRPESYDLPVQIPEFTTYRIDIKKGEKLIFTNCYLASKDKLYTVTLW